MGIKWIPHPRAGTSVLPGRWMCTVASGRTRKVEVLDLEGVSFNGSGDWFRHGGDPLSARERVVAIAHVPDPWDR